MRLVSDHDREVSVELSESNLRALLADFERNGSTDLTKYTQGVTLRVSVRRDDVHYSDAELALRGPDWKGAVNA